MKNKTRKLLGRFIPLLIIIALVLSAFSCAKEPTEDGAVADSLKTENNIPPENNKEKTGEKTDSSTENAKDLDPKEAEQNNEAQDPMAFTVNDKFSAYEVAVVLTDEETAKNKQYTIADFEEYDISSIIDYNCYPEQFYPEHKGRRSFVLLLNEPSKERVLEYCEKLSKDPRVQLAEPNIYPVEKGFDQYVICAELTDYAIKNLGNMTFRFFNDIDFEYVEVRDGIDDICHFYMNDCDEKTYYENLKKLMEHKYIERAFPMVTYIGEDHLSVTITHERYAQNPVFTIHDFPEIEVLNISTPIEINCEYTDEGPTEVEKYCTLMLTHKPTKKIYKIIENLKNNPIIKDVRTPGMEIISDGTEYKVYK